MIVLYLSVNWSCCSWQMHSVLGFECYYTAVATPECSRSHPETATTGRRRPLVQLQSTFFGEPSGQKHLTGAKGESEKEHAAPAISAGLVLPVRLVRPASLTLVARPGVSLQIINNFTEYQHQKRPLCDQDRWRKKHYHLVVMSEHRQNINVTQATKGQTVSLSWLRQVLAAAFLLAVFISVWPPSFQIRSVKVNNLNQLHLRKKDK